MTLQDKAHVEKAVAPHSSTLAWKIPWMEKPGRLQSMLRVRHNWATSLSLFAFMHWRRKWQPTPVFLPGESQGPGEPGGLPSMGSHRVGHNWSDLAAAAADSPPQKEAKNNVPYLDTEKKRKMDNKNRNTIGKNHIYNLPWSHPVRNSKYIYIEILLFKENVKKW